MSGEYTRREMLGRSAKIAGVLALGGLAARCASKRVLYDQYNHTNYKPEIRRPSRIPEVIIPKAVGKFVTKVMDALVYRGKQTPADKNWADVDYRKVIYLVARLEVPKVVLDAETLRQRYTPEQFRNTYESIPKEHFTVSENSEILHPSALEELLKKESWKVFHKPPPKDKNPQLILTIAKGHAIARCLTGEHVVNEEDYGALTAIELRTTSKTRPIELHPPVWMLNDYELKQLALHNKNIDPWKKHYEEKHTLKAEERSRKSSEWMEKMKKEFEKDRRLRSLFP